MKPIFDPALLKKITQMFARYFTSESSEPLHKYWAMPKRLWPQVKLPQIKLPQLQLPKIEAPKLPEFKINLPKFKLPKLVLPKFTASKIVMPKVSVPKFALPKVTLPKMSLPWPLPKVLDAVFLFVALSIIGLGVIAVKDYYIADASANIESDAVRISELDQQEIDSLGNIEPASGEAQAQGEGRYPIEEPSLDVQAVLVPNAATVISSSRDGKIAKINFDNGDIFSKGDVLVEYACEDVKAEVEIAKSEKELLAQKSQSTAKLFKLDIISDYERLEIETKDKQAQARVGLYENKMEDCYIRADYDGRVVKRLGNPGEFTRTDRVIMEVASKEYLKAEFLIPSRWLRWVNVEAPVSVHINETGASYEAKIMRIYGEVDPVSQSIQVAAQLEPYEDRLLPGMSGQITLDAGAIRSAGIVGFLDVAPPQ
jgi:membrane fusion protein (multidrug efflux system)